MTKAFSTANLARASARRPWITIGLRLVALVAALVATAALLGGVLTTDSDFTGTPESKAAELLIDERLENTNPVSDIVLVRSSTLTVDDPAFEQRVDALAADLRQFGDVSTFYESRDPQLVSEDRDTTIINLLLYNDDDVGAFVDSGLSLNGVDGFETAVTGVNVVDEDFNTVASEDLKKGELIGIGVALLVLVLVFGAIVASLVPLLLAIVSIVVALGLTSLIGQAFELSFFVVNMLVMMGLAVGIDYALFIVSRFREERARGLDKVEAIAMAGSTANRAVFFSGVTVVLALIGMLIVPTTIFMSLAIGAILVVFVSVIAALTLLPAVLHVIGDKIDRLRLPFRRGPSATSHERGIWAAIARGVVRRPALSLVAGVAIMVAAAFPLTDINTGFAGVDTLPEKFVSKQGFDLLDEEFAFAQTEPVQIVVDGDVRSMPVQTAIGDLQATLAADPRFGEAEPLVNDAGDLALLEAPIIGGASSDQAVRAVRDLRETIIPASFPAGSAEVFVGGETASNVDFFDLTDQYLPIVFAFVLGLSFLLLAVAFRSIVIPIKSIIMNLLSVGAAYGLMVLVFQKGYLAGLFGFQQVDTVEAWIPLFLFSVLFGLSMDYHVFLLSRIRERFDQTRNNTDSIVFGVGTTSRIITGAALIMVAVFGGFAAGNLVMFQQMGFGLAVAVLLDATLVRSVLVPAAMQLLGRWNWYLPKRLEWIPNVGIEGSPRPVRPTGEEAPQAT